MPGVRTDGSGAFGATKAGLVGLNTTVAAWSAAWWMASAEFTGDRTLFIQYGAASNRQGFYIMATGATYTTIEVSSMQDAGRVSVASAVGFLPKGYGWRHYAFSWDGTTVRFYRDTVLHSVGAMATAPTASANPTTTMSPIQPRVALFDFKVFPGVALTDGEIRATRDPRRVVAGCAGRWFRNWRWAASGSLLQDETGSGNDLVTGFAGRMEMCEEPPWREAVGAR